VVNTLIFANLAHRPLRSFLTVLAIGVEVTMILTLVGVSNGTLDSAAQRARGVGADIVVRPPGSTVLTLGSAPMSQKLVALLDQQPGVELATGTVVQSLGGFDSLTGVDYDEIDRMSGTQLPGGKFLPGFHYFAGGPMKGPDDVIVDEYYAKEKHVVPGDHLNLANHDWQVSGIYESGKLARIISRRDTLQQVIGNEGKVSQIFVKVKDPKQTDAIVNQLKHLMNPNDPNQGYQIYSMEEFTSMLTVNSVGMLKEFIDVVIGVATIVGFIVVFMAMYTAVLERTREIGILKAVGAGPWYILNILFRETIVLALCGSVLGIAFTYGTQWLMTHVVHTSLAQETVYSWWPITVAIAVIGAIVGTIIPAVKAVNQEATEALSYE
jgi:putative ABC transport system permease protein